MPNLNELDLCPVEPQERFHATQSELAKFSLTCLPSLQFAAAADSPPGAYDPELKTTSLWWPRLWRFLHLAQYSKPRRVRQRHQQFEAEDVQWTANTLSCAYEEQSLAIGRTTVLFNQTLRAARTGSDGSAHYEEHVLQLQVVRTR